MLIFENYNEITKICKKYKIKNYHINPDGTIDVDGNVFLYEKGLKYIPIKFGKVSGWFDCSNNQLTTLEGVPKEVGGDFYCNYNQLTTLEGAPKKVGGDFDCHHNQLTNLEGAPKEVGRNFDCRNNQLTTLEGGPKKVSGWFACSNNQLTSLVGAPNEVRESFSCNNNKLTSLAGSPKIVGWLIYFIVNPLPKKIIDNYKYIKDIFYWQDEYNIWRKDGTLNKFRFDEMMIDILNDWKEGINIK
jgi:hypothetical protein